MNQNSNDFNQTKLNQQVNTGVLNNQQINTNNNIQQAIFNEYQQPINRVDIQSNNKIQQPIEQPVQNQNVSFNNQDSNNGHKKKKLGLIIGIIVVLIIVILVAVVFLQKLNDTKLTSNENDNQLTSSEKTEYAEEIKMIKDYFDEHNEYFDINEKSIEHIVSFAHKKLNQNISSIDFFGTEDYIENDSNIILWQLIVNTDDDYFYVSVKENTGVIYKITYNDEVFYDKINNYDTTTTTKEKSKVDWSKLDITLNGVKYKYPWKGSDFIDSGWEAHNSSSRKKLQEVITPDYTTFIDLEQEDLVLSLIINNNTTADINIVDANVTGLQIGLYEDDSTSNFDFYGIKVGTTKEKIEKILGTPDYINEDNSRDNYTYMYTKELSDGSTVDLALEIDMSSNALYELNIDIY